LRKNWVKLIFLLLKLIVLLLMLNFWNYRFCLMMWKKARLWMPFRLELMIILGC
jgi:hypothetical protein